MREEEFFKLLGEAIWLREERVQEIEEALARVVVKLFNSSNEIERKNESVQNYDDSYLNS